MLVTISGHILYNIQFVCVHFSGVDLLWSTLITELIPGCLKISMRVTRKARFSKIIWPGPETFDDLAICTSACVFIALKVHDL